MSPKEGLHLKTWWVEKGQAWERPGARGDSLGDVKEPRGVLWGGGSAGSMGQQVTGSVSPCWAQTFMRHPRGWASSKRDAGDVSKNTVEGPARQEPKWMCVDRSRTS